MLALNRIAVEALLKAGAYPLENDNVVSLTPLELLTKYLDHSAGRVEDWTEAGGLIGFGFAAWQMEAMLKQARPIAKMLEVATREVSIIDRINYMLER